jgi:hypothetical protein
MIERDIWQLAFSAFFPEIQGRHIDVITFEFLYEEAQRQMRIEVSYANQLFINQLRHSNLFPILALMEGNNIIIYNNVLPRDFTIFLANICEWMVFLRYPEYLDMNGNTQDLPNPAQFWGALNVGHIRIRPGDAALQNWTVHSQQYRTQ